MNKESQLQFIKRILEERGEISRNFCLANYISRLGARVGDLKKMGYQFKTETRETIKPDGSKGKDFVYVITYNPNRPPQVLPQYKREEIITKSLFNRYQI